MMYIARSSTLHRVTERGVEIFVHPSENNLESLRKCRGRPIFDGAGAVGPGPRDRSDSRGSVHNRKELREAAYAANIFTFNTLFQWQLYRPSIPPMILSCMMHIYYCYSLCHHRRRINKEGSVDLAETVEFNRFFQLDRGKLASAARNWIQICPPNRRDDLCLSFCINLPLCLPCSAKIYWFVCFSVLQSSCLFVSQSFRLSVFLFLRLSVSGSSCFTVLVSLSPSFLHSLYLSSLLPFISSTYNSFCYSVVLY